MPSLYHFLPATALLPYIGFLLPAVLPVLFRDIFSFDSGVCAFPTHVPGNPLFHGVRPLLLADILSLVSAECVLPNIGCLFLRLADDCFSLFFQSVTSSTLNPPEPPGTRLYVLDDATNDSVTNSCSLANMSAGESKKNNISRSKFDLPYFLIARSNCLPEPRYPSQRSLVEWQPI